LDAIRGFKSVSAHSFGLSFREAAATRNLHAKDFSLPLEMTIGMAAASLMGLDV
jgi:hypothetical protein